MSKKSFLLIAMDDDDDREAQDAWERAQMRRMNVDMGDPLEAPPVAARIPLVSAQPTPRSCMARLEALRAQWEHEAVEPVSYTHLTLPTICSV